MEKYIKVKENATHTTHLRVRLYYSLGGMNYATYQIEPRGYYLSISPVEYKISKYGYVTESYTAFTGIKQIIKGVSRKSKKAEAEAEKLAEVAIDRLIGYVCRENGLEILVE